MPIMSGMGRIDEVTLVEISRIAIDLRSSRASRPVYHPHHEILVPVRGVYRCLILKKEFAVQPGEALFLPSGTENQILDRFLGETVLFLMRWCGSPLAAAPTSFPDRHGRLPWCCAWLRDLTGPAASEDRRDRLARLIVEECSGILSGDGQPEDAFGQVHRYIDDNISSDDLDIDDLRRVINVSRATLYRLFADQTGMTPMRYLRQKRLELAVDLVRRTRLPLSDIAERVGVRSTTHLSTLIARLTGRRPQAWRRESHR